MRFNFPLLFIILSLSIPSLGETMDDVVQREGLIYKKFTDIPFTGEVEGNEQGFIKNGKRDGPWISYHDKGQLENKINYKDGKAEGLWVEYRRDGSINEDVTGTYKNGEKISD